MLAMMNALGRFPARPCEPIGVMSAATFSHCGLTLKLLDHFLRSGRNENSALWIQNGRCHPRFRGEALTQGLQFGCIGQCIEPHRSLAITS